VRNLAIVLFAVLLVCDPALASDKQEIHDCTFWQLGKDEAEKARLATACDRIIKSKGFSPSERAEAYAERADRASHQNRSDAAIADFDKALELAPDRVEWRRDRALLLHFAAKHGRAIRDFDQLLAAKPDDTHATFFRGLSRLEVGDEAAGFADLEKGIALDPTDAWHSYTRANELSKRGRTDAAIADLTTSISLKPDDKDSYLLRSDLYAKMGDKDKAIADLTRAVELDPKSVVPRWKRADLYKTTGQLDRALADFDELLRLEPGDRVWTRRKTDVLKKMAALPKKVAPAAEEKPPVAARQATELKKAPPPVHKSEDADVLQDIRRLYQDGDYASAIPLAQRYADLVRDRYGENSPKLGIAFANLAELQDSQALLLEATGKLAEATRFRLDAVAVRERAFGADHPEVAASLTTLGALYQAQVTIGPSKCCNGLLPSVRRRCLPMIETSLLP
jgi:tetratricopeptide (TPR) repeat protein